MIRPPHDPGPVLRLSPDAPRRGRSLGPCPDELVAEARRLVEGSTAPLGRIARQLGVAGGTLSKWALNGGWSRPLDAPIRPSRFGLRRGARRSPRLLETRRGLRAADGILGMLEAAGPPAPAESGPALDRLAEALAELDEAGRAFTAPPGPRRGRSRPGP